MVIVPVHVLPCVPCFLLAAYFFHYALCLIKCFDQVGSIIMFKEKLKEPRKLQKRYWTVQLSYWSYEQKQFLSWFIWRYATSIRWRRIRRRVHVMGIWPDTIRKESYSTSIEFPQNRCRFGCWRLSIYSLLLFCWSFRTSDKRQPTSINFTFKFVNSNRVKLTVYFIETFRLLVGISCRWKEITSRDVVLWRGVLCDFEKCNLVHHIRKRLMELEHHVIRSFFLLLYLQFVLLSSKQQ